MAQVFSLICWGGYTGKTVTGSNNGGYLLLTTSAAHGVRTGMGLAARFTATTLPGNIGASTTYYLGYGTSTTTMYVYDTEAHAIAGGTTGRVAYSSAGTSVVAKSAMVADPSNALAPYGLSNLSRWDAGGGSYRIYDGIVSWITGRSGASPIDTEICEIGEAFTETQTSGSTANVNIPAGAIFIEAKVNGVWSSAYHAGVVGAGYIFWRNNNSYGCVQLTTPNATIDGVTAQLNSGLYTSLAAAFWLYGYNTSAKNCIAIGPGDYASYGIGFYGYAAMCRTVNCLAIQCKDGFHFRDYFQGIGSDNCTASKCTNGIKGSATNNIWAVVRNCVSLGNTTNWAAVSGLYTALNNAGGTGEAWMTTGGTRVEITESSPYSATFANWTNNDFRPASGSQLIDAGVEYYGILPYDIAGDEVPNYNNGGSEAVDIGAYEYDHGYGTRPASTTVTFDGVPANSEIRVYDSGGVELAGIESSAANPVLTWDVASGAQRIVIVNLAYRIKEFAYTNQAGAQTVPVQMDADPWYENP